MRDVIEKQIAEASDALKKAELQCAFFQGWIECGKNLLKVMDSPLVEFPTAVDTNTDEGSSDPSTVVER